MSGNSDRRQIEEIKHRVDIVDLISRYLEVKPAGKNYKAICPFHNEKTPSLMISPELQTYKCFGCGAYGDIFTFLTEHEHIDFREALEQLAKEAGVKLEKQSSSHNKYFAILEMINNLAASFYNKQLDTPQGKSAKNYLNKRGFGEETIEKFRLGYSPGGDSLLKHLKSKAKFTKQQLLSSGLFTEKKGQMRDKFFARTIFPIHNSRGKIIAFNGRVLPGNDFGPKYLHSPETPLFHKKETVYGIYQARKGIRAQDLAIICEGATDVISCHQHEILNVIAPLGTALTEEQVFTISKYSKNILLFFDNDDAGQKAVERGFLVCTKMGVNPFAANTGKYKDLDEAIKADKKFVKRSIKARQDGFTYLVSKKLRDSDLENLEQYKDFVKYVAVLLQYVKRVDDLNFYLNKAQKLSGISKSTLQSAISSIKTGNFRIASSNLQSKQTDTKEKTTREYNPIRNFEYYFTALILQSNKYSVLDNEKIEIKYFRNTSIKKILKTIAKLKKSSEPTIEKITKALDGDKKTEQLFEDLVLDGKIAHSVENTADIAKECQQVYRRIKNEALEMKRQKLRSKLLIEEEVPDANINKINDLSKKIEDITKLIAS